MKRLILGPVKDEEGQAFILVLIFLLVGGLIIAPLLTYMSTGLKVGQMHEKKMDELYAADAGVEDALYKIQSDDASLQALDEEDSHTYALTGSVNGETVNVTVTKLALLKGLVDDSEYKVGQPHEDWVKFKTPTPIEVGGTATYVEYDCVIAFDYLGVGNRRVQGIGAFFTPSTKAVIEGPYDIVYTLEMTGANLESLVTDMVSGGFQFVWRWQSTQGPRFSSGDTGTLSFSFKVYDPGWDYSLYFIWVLVQEQDISFVTNAPDSYKWLIEATAGDTEVRSAVLDHSGLHIMTWEINP